MANIRKNGVLNSRIKGDDGEVVACKYLENKGYCIVCRNYQKAWGELDIIASKDNLLHFIEVKSVANYDRNAFSGSGVDVSHISQSHRPEENVHSLKVRHIRRMVETYLAEFHSGLDIEFRFHVICVYMNFGARRAKVKMIENIIL